jgi:hypothetical protein
MIKSMNGRQRKRILNIIRCRKNVKVLKLIRSEKVKVDNIQREVKTTMDPEFIHYFQDGVKVLEGFTKHQVIKIELEALLSLIDKARIGIDDYHRQLDVLLGKLNTSSLNKKPL